MTLEVRQLRALVAVADEGTFTDAAIALGLSQAAVSRTVATLEGGLGTRLLQRTSRGAVPTAAGARVLVHARRVLDEVLALEREAAGGTGELRVGYAWAAFGRHTTTLQRRWLAEHPGSTLLLVHASTPTAGLLEGVAEMALVRRPLDDRRFETALVGVEARYAAVATDHRLARRRSVSMDDFAGTVVAVDSRTGTTTQDLWPSGAAPAATREAHGIDEWLSLIAAGQALGLTSQATARQHPRPGVTYRRVRGAQPVPVLLAWWRDDPPPHAAALVHLASELYAVEPAVRRPARAGAGARSAPTGRSGP